MKFNFRKIASVIASTVMLCSTAALAAAANYPSPFVKSGVADVAVVYPSSALAAVSDYTAAVDISTNLQSKIVVSGPTTIIGGDFIKLQRSTDKFSIGQDMNDFYSSLDEEELSKVLVEGTYLNDANDEFTYDQKIELSDLNLTYFQDDDFNDEAPLVGFALEDGIHVLNYTLDFTPDSADCGDFGLSAATDDDCETTEIGMLGRNYYIVKTESVTTNGVKLTLLDTANSATITEGETQTVTVNGVPYDIKIDYIADGEAIIEVGGVKTNVLEEGDVFKVGTDLYLGVKNILWAEKESGISQVDVSLGSGKIVFENGQEVEINNEDVSDISDSVLTSYIFNTTTEIDKIVLDWDIDDDVLIAPGTDLVFPGFETIKISMGGFIEPTPEVTSIDNDGDGSIQLTTYATDGKVSFNLLYANSTGDGWAGLGKDATHRLMTSTAARIRLDDDTHDQFVASWINGDEAESYVLEIADIDGSDSAKNTTTFSSIASGSSKGIELDIGETDDLGQIRFTLNSVNETLKDLVVTIAAAGSGSVTLNKLYTAAGLTIELPVNDSTTLAAARRAQMINASDYNGQQLDNTIWVLNMSEEDDDGQIGVGLSKLNLTLGFTTDNEAQVSDVDVDSVTGEPIEADSDTYLSYVTSPLATRVVYKTDGDPDTAKVEYHPTEAYGEVFVSEAGAAIASSTETTAGKVLVVKDSETVTANNKVVVGGSCINTVAATLLGGAYCGAAFEAKTGVGAGSYLIKTFALPGGGVATLVAGYNAEDTLNAEKYLTTQADKIDTTANKAYKGTTATSASPQVTSV